jgi:hypothetical protein
MFSRIILVFVVVFVALAVLPPPAVSQGNYQTIQSAHFKVRYMPDIPEAEAQRVAAFLQEDYDTLKSQLGLDLTKTLEVRMYDSPARFRSEINMGREVLPAVYVRGILHVLEPVPPEGLDVALRYQLARVFLEQTGKYSCPIWLREAFAVFHSGKMRDLSPPASVTVSAFSDLTQDLEEAQTPVERNDVDFVLGRTMEFFVQKYGEQKSFSVFKEFAETPTEAKVFKKVFGDEFPDIEKRWAKFVAIKPRKAK